MPEPGRLPNFLIIGAAKSGTTSLAFNLAKHPDVYVAPQKEVHFFDEHWERGLEWYRAQFAGAHHEPAVGEATPAYMALSEARVRMAETVPQARLIAVLRDPVERTYAAYWHQVARAGARRTFTEALEAEPECFPGRSEYVTQLQSLCEHYPRASLRVFVFDDLRDRPHEVFADVCAFLEIDASYLPPVRPYNAYVSSGYLRRMERERRLPRPIRRVARHLRPPPKPYAPMDLAMRRRLEDRFREPNRKLAAWLGRELPWDNA